MADDDIVVLIFPRLDFPEPGIMPEERADDDATRARVFSSWLEQLNSPTFNWDMAAFGGGLLRGPRPASPDTVEFPVGTDAEASADASPVQVRLDTTAAIDFLTTERRIMAQYADLANLPRADIEIIRENLTEFMRSIRDQGPILIDSLSHIQEYFGNPRTWAGVGQAFRELSGLLHDAEAAVPSSVSDAFREVDPTLYRDDLNSHRIDEPGLAEIVTEWTSTRRLSRLIEDVLAAELGPTSQDLAACYGYSKRYDYLDSVPMCEPVHDPGGDEIRGRVHRPSIAAQERRDRSRFANYGTKGLPKSGVREYRRRRR